MSKGGGTKIKMMDPYQGTGVRELYQDLYGMMGPSIQQGGLTPYSGQMTPGPSPLQQQGFNMMGGMGSMFGPAQDISQQALGQYEPAQGQRAQQMGMTAMGQMGQPFDPSMITQTMKPVGDYAMGQYKDEMVPWLAEKYGPALGAKESGAFGRELAKGGERLGMGLAAQFAPYQMAGYENQMNRMAQVPGLSQQMAMGPMNMLNQALGGAGQYPFQIGQGMMGAGGEQRAITGQQMAEPYEKWRMSQPWAPEFLNMLNLGLGQPPKEIVGMPQQAGFGSSLLAGMAPAMGAGMGGGLMGAMMPGMTMGQGAMLAMLSDERAKDNIAHIDNALEKLSKLSGKTYNYITTPDRRDGGLVAQQVEKVLPEGVIEHNGLKYVKMDAVIALVVNAVNELVCELKLRNILPRQNQ